MSRAGLVGLQSNEIREEVSPPVTHAELDVELSVIQEENFPVKLDSQVIGNLAVTHLNSGTLADATTFWRGDGSWAAAGAGSVTSVSVTTANGVSGSVATATTTPAITLVLGAIVPTSVNSVVISGASTPTLAVTGTSSVSGANTGDQTNVTGNAATVTTNANLTGHVTSTGNAAVLGSFTVAQLNTAVSDADVATLGANTLTGAQVVSTAGAASTPAEILTGAWFTGGSGTTTFPHLLLQATGTTASTTWSTAGTGIGVNAVTGFAGNLLDLKVAGTSVFSVATAGTITTATSLILGSGSHQLTWSGKSRMFSPSDGVIQLLNQASNDFGRLQFGGITSSFPAIKRSGTGLIVRLADDSANAPLTASNVTLTGGLVGKTDASNATAGNVGEYIESLIASGSAVSLTTATAANVTSISLTAGDWDVFGNISIAGSTATYTQGAGGITSTSATIPTDGSEVYSGAQFTLLSVTDGVTIPLKRISVSSTTTVYLVARATFSAGSMTAYGKIAARRIR